MKASRSLAAVILTYSLLLFVATSFGVIGGPTNAFADTSTPDLPIGSDTLRTSDTLQSTTPETTEPSAWDLFLIMVENVVL